jgi:tyrosinase
MFFLHHGQIGRTRWIWQNQDLANRQNAIAGTITLDDNPPNRNGTLTDTINMGVNAPTVQIKDLMSKPAGPLCYIYV